MATALQFRLPKITRAIRNSKDDEVCTDYKTFGKEEHHNGYHVDRCHAVCGTRNRRCCRIFDDGHGDGVGLVVGK